MPTYRLTPPGELVQADRADQEGIHLVLRGTTLIMGKPREVVIRRIPSSVQVELVDKSQTVGTTRGVPLI